MQLTHNTLGALRQTYVASSISVIVLLASTVASPADNMPTIAEVLIPKLRSNFGDQAFTLRKEAAEVCIVFASPHVDFGDVEIVDDGYEVTIQVGRFTHGHFANYDDRLSTTQAHEAIACDVTRFLRDLFEDRIVLWGSHGGGGGWYSIGHKPASRSLDHGNEFVWSGPRSTSS